MKIVSDNSEFLDKVHKELKLAHIKVKKETKPVDGAMADEITTALDLLDMAQENWERVAFYVGAVRETAKYLKASIKVEKKDGTFISWEEYEKMTDEEKTEVF
ncbi:MAG: Unknown protein [uncultured Sulfurovum sp.]|uniref:Uncharacterized protein n=1 Tax=uncultured Sulfurovum sp. TaxID=269237 RepID=A0A6S6TQM8_9BACT|nr:MAG: Unknown protein [uncultured Sulfurovum sp.]